MILSQKIYIRNDSAAPAIVYIEPWAEEVTLSPDDLLGIDINYNKLGSPLISYGESSVTIYLWSSCTCKVNLNGVGIVMPSLELSPP